MAGLGTFEACSSQFRSYHTVSTDTMLAEQEIGLNITVLYVGSSLLAPLKDAEREINRLHQLQLRVAAYNFGAPLSDREWQEVNLDLSNADVGFVIHVMDGENAARLMWTLELYKDRHNAVVGINF